MTARTVDVKITGDAVAALAALAATAAGSSRNINGERSRRARIAARRIVAEVLWAATGHPTDVQMRGVAAAELAERMNDGRVPITALPSTLWRAVTS